MCPPCLIIIQSCYFDCRINTPFTRSRCVTCVSCSVHLVSTHSELGVQRIMVFFILPTSQWGRRIQSNLLMRKEPVQRAWVVPWGMSKTLQHVAMQTSLANADIFTSKSCVVLRSWPNGWPKMGRRNSGPLLPECKYEVPSSNSNMKNGQLVLVACYFETILSS